MDLAQSFVGNDLQPGALRQRLCGLVTPGQVAGVQGRWRIAGKQLRRPTCLLVAHLVKRDVGLTLKAIDDVPLGAAVAPKDDSRGRHRRSSTLSLISGQSRHSRSNA